MVSTGVMTITTGAIPRERSDLRYELSNHTGAITIQRPMILEDEASERGYVSRLWAEDWDSAEDSIYDA